MPTIISGSTGISGTDGTAATPAVQGTDTNTGIFFPAADTIAFAEGGTEVVRIDSSGQVGIGTSTPIRRLTLAQNGTPEFVIQDTSQGTDLKNWRIYNVSQNFIIGTLNDAGTSGTNAMVIDRSGRVTMPAQPVYAGYGRNPASPLNTGSESTAVIWIPGTTTINRGSHFNTSTGRFTCPIAGVYYIHGFFLTRSNAAHNITVNRNGSSTGFAGRDIATAGEQGTSVSAYVDCAANDILDIRVSNGSGGDFFDNFSGILISLYG